MERKKVQSKQSREQQEDKENRYDLIKRIAERIQRGMFGDCEFERYQDD